MEVREPSAKYLARTGYKQTEVGMIPEDWNVDALDTLGKHGRPAIKAGPFGSSLTKTTYVAEGYKVYGQEQVIRGDYLHGDYYITKSHFNELKTCAVEPGDILLSLVGTAGRVLVIPPGAPAGIINPRLIRFSFDPGLVSPHYFKFLFETGVYQALLARSAQGGTMGVLNAGLLRPICIPIPQIAEQKAIAEALSDANALIESLEQLLAKKRQIKQGTMQELLTGKKRLPGFGGKWESKLLKKSIQIPVTDGPHLTPIFLNDGVPFLSVNNLVNNGIDLSSLRYISREDHAEFSRKCKPQKDDVLLGKAASVGRVAIVDIDIEFNIWSPIALIRVSNGNIPRFVYYSLQTDSVIRQIELLTNSSSQGNIGMGDIERLVLVLPGKEEQQAIADILSDMDADTAALKTKLAKARHLKQGMMQELLTGRIRLI